MDAFFVADIVLNFRTAVVAHSTRLVINRREIAHDYLKGWFGIDMASSIPWETFLIIWRAALSGGDAGGASNANASGGGGGGGGVVAGDGDARLASLGALKVLKLPKVLRLGRLLRLMSGRLGRMGIVSKIVALIVGVALLTHWLCAAWYVLVQRGDGDGAWRDEAGAPPLDAPIAAQHAFYFYQTMMMVMGDGTGPTDQLEVIFTCFCVLLGACVNAAVFANVAWLVSQMSASSAFHQKRMEQIDSAMKRVGVKPSTAARVRAYYEYRWQCHRDHEVDEFVASLPAQLRSDVSCLLHWRLIRRCPLFASADRRLVAAVSTALQPEVYLPSEFILVAGYVSSCMYLISRGRVLVVEREIQPGDAANDAPQLLDADADDLDAQLASYARSSLRLERGADEQPPPRPGTEQKSRSKWLKAAKSVASGVRDDYFGERGLLSAAEQGHGGKGLQQYETSARAITHVDLFRLQRHAFDELIAQYPKPAVHLVETARQVMPHDFAAVFARKIDALLAGTRDEASFVKQSGAADAAAPTSSAAATASTTASASSVATGIFGLPAGGSGAAKQSKKLSIFSTVQSASSASAAAATPAEAQAQAAAAAAAAAEPAWTPQQAAPQAMPSVDALSSVGAASKASGHESDQEGPSPSKTPTKPRSRRRKNGTCRCGEGGAAGGSGSAAAVAELAATMAGLSHEVASVARMQLAIATHLGVHVGAEAAGQMPSPSPTASSCSVPASVAAASVCSAGAGSAGGGASGDASRTASRSASCEASPVRPPRHTPTKASGRVEPTDGDATGPWEQAWDTALDPGAWAKKALGLLSSRTPPAAPMGRLEA